MGYSLFPPLTVLLFLVFYRSDNCSHNDDTQHQCSKFSPQSGLCHCHGLVYCRLLRICVLGPNWICDRELLHQKRMGLGWEECSKWQGKCELAAHLLKRILHTFKLVAEFFLKFDIEKFGINFQKFVLAWNPFKVLVMVTLLKTTPQRLWGSVSNSVAFSHMLSLKFTVRSVSS